MASGARPTSASALGIEKGTIVGAKYRVLEPLGIGGMGSIWLAHNQTLDIEVALKVLRADLGKIPKDVAAERMLQEARAAAKLIHPAIVRINDYGRTEHGDPYLVMERLVGIDLATALDKRGRIGAVKSVRTLLPIVDALAFAHEREVIHRDVKPENIFVCRTDEGKLQPKLIDFGVARLEERVERRLTSPGAMMGSPGYMAPEQARGKDADERVDVWALAVVLYEMVTGRNPFEGESLLALVRAIVEDEAVPIREYGVGDEALWAIIEKGLAKSADARWQTARELGLALAEWLLQNGVLHDITGASIIDGWSPRPELRATDDVFKSEPPPWHMTPSPHGQATPPAWSNTPGSWPGLPSLRSAMSSSASISSRSPSSGEPPPSGPVSAPWPIDGEGSGPAKDIAQTSDRTPAPSARLRGMVETQPLPIVDETTEDRTEAAFEAPRGEAQHRGSSSEHRQLRRRAFRWQLAFVALTIVFAALLVALLT